MSHELSIEQRKAVMSLIGNNLVSQIEIAQRERNQAWDERAKLLHQMHELDNRVATADERLQFLLSLHEVLGW